MTTDVTTVWDKLNTCYYSTPSIPYPDKPNKPLIPSNPSANDLRRIAGEIEKYENDQKVYKAARAAYTAELGNREQEFRNDLEAHYDMTGHPKADLLYDMAWNYGHSAGFMDVATYYSDMVLLVKD